MEEAKTQNEQMQTNDSSSAENAGAMLGLEASAKQQFVPYELSAPQNYPKEFVDEFQKFALSEKMPKELAQKILEREANLHFQQQEAWNALVERWTEEAQNDKEFGGVEFSKNLEIANRALKRFGSESLIQELLKSGFSNHPEFIRLFYRIGKAMSEDEFVYPKHNVDSKPQKSMAEILYPSLYQQKT